MRWGAVIIGAGVAGLGLATSAGAATTITVATVNNPDMVTMQKMTDEFTKAHPDVKVNYVTLPENELRQKITTDIASGGGQYDVITVSNYETPIWAKNGWLKPMDNLPDDYQVDDLLPTVRQGLSYDGTLYALPFYAESSMTYYRKDLFKKAGIEMPDRPTWDQMKAFAQKLHDPSNGVYGICLRGLPGWGQNMAFFDTMVNSYGGRWFDMEWKPQLTSEAWHKAASDYKMLMNKYGPPGVTSNGFTESETLFANGQCGMWVDSTVAAGYVSDPDNSKVADSVGFAQAPYQTTKNGANWLYSWALAVPKSAPHSDAAQAFVDWATSKQYIQSVAEKKDWLAVPPGTRQSTYDSEGYQQAAPFSSLVRTAISSADPENPTADPVPYTGIQFISIPQFQAIGTRVGQIMAGVLAGQTSVDQGLNQAQQFTARLMKQSGYDK
ncbi:sorbitol/mannitol transport system substrate-binding protein [Kushneria sinocarnis]|uniref:Sorbitol/mannitol transport system substrate-binding protein n=1 Tax=Kushneria sinocarnis TaxID=595502 RepID=A0A420WTX6_9GAMM|nr:sugar ABC transporter substrate-binding protein [Kushneria sinocarnis]RKQ96886.1 sorbitol/mannitol transport system substrate-binding protein [Kushneria sinocarnis]